MEPAAPKGLQVAIIRFSIRFRGVVIALAIVLAFYGIHALRQANYDVFPEFSKPQVGIQTESPGLASDQVETLVTQPLENSINGVPGLQSLRSTSIQGLSIITVTFDPGTDIYRDRQIVAERLAAAAAQLPQGVETPIMTPLTSSTSIVMVAGLASKNHSIMDLGTVAAWIVKPRLLAVPGVAKVAVFGGETKSIQVQVHPDKLVRLGVGLNEVLDAARRATGIRGAGFIENANQRIVLRTEGQALTPAEVAKTVLTSVDGISVTLGDVASVVEAPVPPIGQAAIDGAPGIVMNISEQYEANTEEVTKRIDAAFDELRPGLEKSGIVLRDDLFRPAGFIDITTENVRSSMLIGGALVIAVLFLFLYDLRTAAISCIAIPLSLLAAIIVLQRFGITLNTLTLGGFAISIGVVVDDAVVDVENIVRRLRENRRTPQPRSASRVVFDACLEVRSSVAYATFAVLLAVLPIVTLSGLAGRLFAPLGVAYALAVMASLVVSLTVIPALSMVLLTGERARATEPPVMRWSRAAYGRLLRGFIHRPNLAIAGVVMLTAAGLAALPFFGANFIPALKEGHFIVHMTAVPGTSLAETMRLGNMVTSRLHKLPIVRSVSEWAGRAELADDTYGPHYSEFEVDLKPLTGDEAETAQADLRAAIADIPGVNTAANSFLTERIEETLSGYTAPVVVNIFGGDLESLDRKAHEVATTLREVPGAADVFEQAPPGLPQLTIRLRKDDLQRFGFDTVAVLDAVRAAYEGDTVGQDYEGSRVFPVIVILDGKDRKDVEQVGDLPLRSPSGRYVQLRQIADIYESSGRYQVLHQQGQRVQTVTANIAGRDLASFVADAKARIARKVSLDPGTYIEFAGTAEAQSRSRADLLLNTGIAFIGIVLLLAIVTRNANNLALVLANLPFAFVGGVAAVFVSGGSLSLGSMVGFVALFGITLRNSILMIAHFEHLVAEEGKPWGLATALEGAGNRLAPILMTSLVTGLGVLPLAIGMNEPGREVEGPMAVVILGGLATSMALNLLVLPALALRYGRFKPATGSEI